MLQDAGYSFESCDQLTKLTQIVVTENWNFWFLSELLSAVVTQNPNHQTFSISTGADPNNGVQLKIQLSQSQNQSQYHNGGYSSALLAKYILQLLLERQEAAATATPIATTESTTALSTTLSTTTTTTTVSSIFLPTCHETLSDQNSHE